ncbi:MAG: hypothetical protein COX46_01250 [bacterium (Candidatus Ratteibacteria) CG23_combo_of_CG06-09_8_20_14_all_48_7]|uniref:Uncharacterized protein n=1 Tax=bacterium (Candidatus Ratteibacteria) CG23_combo_of_CG06-09_8_20_14_all_48_7 TaxID=2014292 RepID=A0A2G9YDJ5_9BACT|nr:MAG: hypothetical protein COX46_01250 [bacterium (Candidatus Ratteibacteria) CG23_combo_of_CG06-09_8_20_14_all_48_7]
MPRGDGTGPAGLGPMTGRAAGFCAGYPVPGYMNPISGRGFWGRGRGGGGRGWGRGAYGYPAYGGGAYPYAPEVTPQQEAEFLKEQAKALQEELKSINERLGTLAKSAQEKK